MKKIYLIAWALLLGGAAKSQVVKPVSARVYTTAQGTDYRLRLTDTLRFASFPQPLETEPCVFVDPARSFQTFLGIGGAITDASAEVFARLSQAKQEELLRAYYDRKEGIGYTLARTTIHSSDFSSGSYTYVAEGDSLLKTFSIAHDRQARLPLLQRAIRAAGGKLTLYVSPWSPPAWMKDNGTMLQGGKLLPRYRQTWANYVIRYIRSLEAEGVPVWGLTVQNEPMARQRWESCIFTAEEERDFIRDYLGPSLQRSGMASKKLIAWDHNRDLIYQRASTILADPKAARYVWGIGYHWYETWTGSSMQFDNVRRVAEAFPSKSLLFTEGTIEKFRFERIGDWALGEKYGHSLVHDFNAGTVGWTDWNILLDENGGPNHVGNFCFAPVIADTRTGELVYTNSYYYLGHFSKFILPGAKRIAASASRDLLQTTAFRNPDGTIVVVVLNTTDSALRYRLWIQGRAVQVEARAHSIATIVF